MKESKSKNDKETIKRLEKVEQKLADVPQKKVLVDKSTSNTSLNNSLYDNESELDVSNIPYKEDSVDEDR